MITSQGITTTYNSQGLVDTITTYDAASGGSVVNQIKRVYNGLGQMTKEYQQHGASVNTSTVGTMSLAVSYAYTADTSPSDLSQYGSRLLSMSYPNGSTVTYDYGTSHSLNDVIGRLESLKQGAVTLEAYKYLGTGTVVERGGSQAGGLTLTYIKKGSELNGEAGDQYAGLDRFGRVIDQRWVQLTSGTITATVDRYTYTYDRDGNRLTKTNSLNSDFSESYTYDSLNRLTATNRSGGTSDDQSWSLDALGNMNSVTTDGTGENRSFNSRNELTGMGGLSITYDDNGNMTMDEQGHTLQYDAWNRLVAVKDVFGILIKGYVYDGLGRRIIQTDGSTATDLYYSAGWQVLEERTGVSTVTGARNGTANGTTTVVNIFSPVYVDALILRDRDTNNNPGDGFEERLYVTQDAQFSVTAVVNSSGTIQERFAYTTYGKREDLDASGSPSMDALGWLYSFQGLRQDTATDCSMPATAI